MAEDTEWLTLADLVKMSGLSMFKVRTTIAALRSTGAIITREKPTDKRVLEINRDSLPTIQNALLNSPKDEQTAASQRPSMPPGFNLKRDDSRLISVQEAQERYDLDLDWINHNLSRVRFPGAKTFYVFLPELEFVVNQAEIIPPGKDVSE